MKTSRYPSMYQYCIYQWYLDEEKWCRENGEFGGAVFFQNLLHAIDAGYENPTTLEWGGSLTMMYGGATGE